MENLDKKNLTFKKKHLYLVIWNKFALIDLMIANI